MKKIAFERRLDVLDMVMASKSGHIGGSMSCMDILVTLYYRVMDVGGILAGDDVRDRFILSKGHCAEALYSVLADRGFIPKESLRTFAEFDTPLSGHPTKKVRGVEAATGALGHGLPLGVGMAMGSAGRVFVLMGDGELAEGTVWEAAMAAAKFRLANLTAVIDRNRLQISGGTEDVMPLEDLGAKFRSFGWELRTCNGHEPGEIADAVTKDRPDGRPLAVIAETVKGYGSAVTENKADWHHSVPNAEQYGQIKSDLKRGRDGRG